MAGLDPGIHALSIRSPSVIPGRAPLRGPGITVGRGHLLLVMAGLGAANHVFTRAKGVDARHKAGHDGVGRG